MISKTFIIGFEIPRTELDVLFEVILKFLKFPESEGAASNIELVALIANIPKLQIKRIQINE